MTPATQKKDEKKQIRAKQKLTSNFYEVFQQLDSFVYVWFSNNFRDYPEHFSVSCLKNTNIIRSSPPEVSLGRKGVLKICSKFTHAEVRFQ